MNKSKFLVMLLVSMLLLSSAGYALMSPTPTKESRSGTSFWDTFALVNCPSDIYDYCWQDSYGTVSATAMISEPYCTGSEAGNKCAGDIEFHIGGESDDTVYVMYNVNWDEVDGRCSDNGCFSAIQVTENTYMLENRIGESYTDCIVAVSWDKNSEYWVWTGYGWIGAGDCFNYEIVECVENSDCRSGNECTASNTCQVGCTEECGFGQSVCWPGDPYGGTGKYQLDCGDYDSDPCLEWPEELRYMDRCDFGCSPVASDGISTCAEEPVCVDECIIGDTDCGYMLGLGTYMRTCADWDNNGCYEFPDTILNNVDKFATCDYGCAGEVCANQPDCGISLPVMPNCNECETIVSGEVDNDGCTVSPYCKQILDCNIDDDNNYLMYAVVGVIAIGALIMFTKKT